jgi:hypothetical protein
MTGCVIRLSPDGGTLIIMVSTEPKLVPTQSVGKVDGSMKRRGSYTVSHYTNKKMTSINCSDRLLWT